MNSDVIESRQLMTFLHYVMDNHSTTVFVTCGLLIWYLIGCTILTIIDKDGKIMKWADSCPPQLLTVLFMIFLPLFWPVILWFYVKNGER